MIWQSRKTQARPAAIVRVGRAQDVADVLRWAKRQGSQVVVKSGGHHLWGSTLREGAVTLDLALLSDVAVDAAADRGAVEPRTCQSFDSGRFSVSRCPLRYRAHGRLFTGRGFWN